MTTPRVGDTVHDRDSITMNEADGRHAIEQYAPGTWHHIH